MVRGKWRHTDCAGWLFVFGLASGVRHQASLADELGRWRRGELSTAAGQGSHRRNQVFRYCLRGATMTEQFHGSWWYHRQEQKPEELILGRFTQLLPDLKTA